MAGPRRGVDDLVDDYHIQTNRALFPYLGIAILGPYTGDCFAYLTELKLQLHDYDFEGAKLATDRGNSPPDEATDEERYAFWRNEATSLMDEADVGIFVFLEHEFDRSYLSEEALAEAKPPSENPKEVNMSVGSELEYWIHNHERRNALMMVEKGISSDIGGQVRGLYADEKIHLREPETHDIDSAVKFARAQCQNWVLGEFQKELEDRTR